MTEEPGSAHGQGFVIETARRLSHSSIFEVQRAYYERSGPGAWSSGEVPHLLTSGPIIARAYATMIAAHLADLAAGRFGPSDATEPVYVIELGAGTGRLGAFLHRELALLDTSGYEVRIVLTDGVRANVEAFLAQRALTPLIAAGVLDVAQYKAGSPARLELASSGATLGERPLANPPIVIANYFLDVLPQDLYALSNGELFEELIALCAREDSLAPDDPELFRKVFLTTTRQALTTRESIEDNALLESVVNDAKESGGADRRFLFPFLALATLRAFAELGEGRLLALIGERPGRALATEDKDLASIAAVEGEHEPLEAAGSLASTPGALLAMGVHGGSMSLPLDFDLLDRFASEGDGELRLPPAEPTALVVALLSLGAAVGPTLAGAHRRLLEQTAPEDLYLTIKAATDREAGATFAMLLGAIRLGGYDPYLLRQCFPMFDRALADAPEEVVDEAVRVLREVHERDFPLDGDPQLALGIATLLAPIGRFSEAAEFYRHSIESFGPSAAAAYNLALCHLHLEEPDKGLAMLELAVSCDDTYAPAVELLAMVRAEKTAREALYEAGPAVKG